jgi:mono/diheme cytochrome c family protein
MHAHTFWVLLAICFGVTSHVGAQDRAKSDVAAEARAILKAACHRCHGDDGTVEGGFSYVLDREQLVSRKQIVPGSAAKSRLIRRVQGNEMPPEGETPGLTKEQITLLAKWVDAGAPDFNRSQPPRKFISPGDMVQSMLEDLQQRDASDRQFTRYLILTHLYNAGRSEDELRGYYHGITKLLNSLSWGRKVAMPALVSSPATILRIDIRDYKWATAVWDKLAGADPYALTYSNMPGAKKLYDESGCALPYVRGDWFVAAAARPPLYHEILQLPMTDRELEALLHVDVDENIRTAQAVRAGFNGSAVSRNNRLIERHDSSYGYYWKSYDFAKNVDRKNLFSHPLGPGTASGDFKHDGGELIFSLPNGFQGYLLVNAEGRRIDKGPIEIVSDPRQPDRAVENGLSCMTCHVRGMLPKDDQIRPHVEKNPKAFSKKELETVLALYPAQERFQALIQDDAEKFRKATEMAGMPPAISEPIKVLATLFEAPLDLPLAAAEAGLKPDGFQKLLATSPALARELGSLQTTGGTVQREAFTKSFAALARAAKLGVPPAKTATTAVADAKSSKSAKTDAEHQTKGKDGWVELGGKNKFPPLLQSSKEVISDKSGLSLKRRYYLLTKKGDYLTRDFKFEVVYTLNEGNGNDIVFIGIGEADRNTAYNEPKNSVHLKIHPSNIDNGYVVLANKEGSTAATLGRIPNGGTHRASIEKIGDVVTFAIDVDNDGPSDDDLEKIIPDIKAFGPYLHKKNTYIFFGGGGVYHRLRLSAPDKTDPDKADDEEK